MAMRHIQIKVWPEINNYLPAFIPYEKIDLAKTNPINIDFSNATNVTSSGLNLFVVEILKIVDKSTSRKWMYDEPDDLETASVLKNLGVFKLLQNNFKSQTLFWDSTISDNLPIRRKFVENEMISFPIYEFYFKGKNNEDKREVVNKFRDFLFENLKFLFDEFKFKINKLIQIFTEMAKNSADHSDDNAYFGLDITVAKSFFKIEFSFGDMGIGINRTIRQYFVDNPELNKTERAKHLGLVETYHFALSPGKSTKPNSKINRGIGMSIIHEVSKDLNISLSVFDAASRALLTKIKNVTHDDLRKNFYFLNKEAGFYYYGELVKIIE